MRGLVIIACIAFLALRSKSWSDSDCACDTCPIDCVPTKQYFRFGGKDICTCYCKCLTIQPPSDNKPPPPPADKKPHHPPPPPPNEEKHQPPPPPPNNCECPSPPNVPVPAPPKTPISQQQCDWWVSKIDPGCDTFAKIIPTMPTGPGFVKFMLGKSCCEAIENARQCYHDLYAGLDLQNNCYH